jgi:hypothetical protein
MITEPLYRPRCQHCRLQLAKPNGKSKLGFQQWHKYCTDCAKAIYSDKHKHLLNKKNICEECGFSAKDRCQLDLIYKDNDIKNKDNTNLLTLCANCSRLYKKTQRLEKKSVLNVTVDDTEFRI